MDAKFADVAPTLAAAGLTETDVTVEAVSMPAEKVPAPRPTITKAKARTLLGWASVYGASFVPPEKQAFAGKTIPDMAFALGLDIDQVATVLAEYRSVSAQATTKVAVADVKTPVEV